MRDFYYWPEIAGPARGTDYCPFALQWLVNDNRLRFCHLLIRLFILLILFLIHPVRSCIT